MLFRTYLQINIYDQIHKIPVFSSILTVVECRVVCGEGPNVEDTTVGALDTIGNSVVRVGCFVRRVPKSANAVVSVVFCVRGALVEIGNAVVSVVKVVVVSCVKGVIKSSNFRTFEVVV